MPTPLDSEEKPQPIEPTPSAPAAIPPDYVGTIAAIGLFVAFFLPWIAMFGGRMSGADIQRHFTSYRLIWLMPLLAVVVVVLNVAKLPAQLFKQLAGASPFVILIYAGYRLQANVGDFLKLLEYGAWVALVCGATLAYSPGKTKKPTSAN